MHRFLCEPNTKIVRFTNTFKSSVIPGQERELSNTPLPRTNKLTTQIQDKNSNPQEFAARGENSSDLNGAKKFTKCRSFVDLMNEGGERNRVTPTYTSSVFPIQSFTPTIKDIRSNSNIIHREGNEASHENREAKWAVSKDDVILEKAGKDKNKVEFYKKYMGINDTPFQRLFKELHGGKGQAPVITNVKKQTDTIGLNYQTTNRQGVYEDLDAKGRRAKEFDS